MTAKYAIACAALLISSAANAQLTGTQVNGSASFAGGPNLFDPVYGLVTAGYGNSSSPNGVTIGSGAEFGLADGANQDTADFTDNQLIIKDNVLTSGPNNPFEMQFTSLTSGAFGGLSLVSNNFAGLTYGLSGDTITVDVPGAAVNANQFYQVIFTIIPGVPGAVPEPSTWAMILLGFAGIGAALRRKHSALATA